ncbi:hypothetical protein BJV82DRAFT_622926 [Fennellomyces sp. T-0311]|nr:hypothetical protein BJV82DRAFT_622926 [Fennellomyces sp. T-0311]
MTATMMVMLSPYGTILDTCPSRKAWHGQPLMRFVHTDDLIRLCAGLSAAYKHIMLDEPLKVRIAQKADDYRWYELAVVESEPQLQIVIQPSDDDGKQSWIHHALENGVTIVAHALVVVVQLLQDHGYHIKNVRYELTDRMLNMLAWAGLVKDLGLAKTLVDRLLDNCVSWYMDHALKHTGPGLCDVVV